MAKTSKNLGQVQALFIGTTPPNNTTMIWYNLGDNLHYYFDTLTASWELLKSGGGAPLDVVLGIGDNTGANNINLSVGGSSKITFTDGNHGQIISSADNLMQIVAQGDSFFMTNNKANGSFAIGAVGTNGQVNFNATGGINADNLIVYNSASTTIAAINSGPARTLVTKEWVQSQSAGNTIYSDDDTVGAGREVTLTDTLEINGGTGLGLGITPTYRLELAEAEWIALNSNPTAASTFGGIRFQVSGFTAYGTRMFHDDSIDTFQITGVENDVDTGGILVIRQTGRVGIYQGSNTFNPAARLHIKGQGSTAATQAFRIQNSSNTDLLNVDDAGRVRMGVEGAPQLGTNSISLAVGISNNAVAITNAPAVGNNTTANNLAINFVMKNSVAAYVTGTTIWNRWRNVTSGSEYGVMVINDAIQTENSDGTSARTLISTRNRHTSGAAAAVLEVENRDDSDSATAFQIACFSQSAQLALSVRSGSGGTVDDTFNWRLKNNHEFVHNFGQLDTGHFILRGDVDDALFYMEAAEDKIGIGIVPTSNSSKFKVNGSVEVGDTDSYYWGDPATDGTWRVQRSGDDLIFQQREAGTYNTKNTISGA